MMCAGIGRIYAALTPKVEPGKPVAVRKDAPTASAAPGSTPVSEACALATRDGFVGPSTQDRRAERRGRSGIGMEGCVVQLKLPSWAPDNATGCGAAVCAIAHRPPRAVSGRVKRFC